MENEQSSQSQKLSALFQVHHVICPHSLASPNDGPPPVNGKSARLLPLVPHDGGNAAVVVVVVVLAGPDAATPRSTTSTRGASSLGVLLLVSRGLRRRRPLALHRLGHLAAQPALLLPPLHLGRRVEQVPHVGDAEAPRRVDGAVFVNDDLHVPRAAQEVDPFAGGWLRGVADGDAGHGLAVAVGERPEVDEGLLGDCVGRAR